MKTYHHRQAAPSLFALLLGLLLCMSPVGLGAMDPCTCAGEFKAVGAAFKVRGRLSAWNGNPTFRIWVVGTKRILGIRSGTKLPDNLQAFLGDFDSEVTGDFVVCPLTKARPGVMQIVCVSLASNLSQGSREKRRGAGLSTR